VSHESGDKLAALLESSARIGAQDFEQAVADNAMVFLRDHK